MRGVKSVRSVRPEQQQHKKGAGRFLAHLTEDVWRAFCNCTLVCLLGGYSAAVIQILLMMSGDVERNPGPGESRCYGDYDSIIA